MNKQVSILHCPFYLIYTTVFNIQVINITQIYIYIVIVIFIYFGGVL